MIGRSFQFRRAGADNAGLQAGAAGDMRPGGEGPAPAVQAPARRTLPLARPARPINCLIIDDSKYDRQRLRRISAQTSLEIAITEVATLDAAVGALRGGMFDVILLDQTLPDGDGTAVADLLRTHLGKQAPPIIMVSGSQESAMPARALASGCIDYISKDNLNIHGLEQAILGTIEKSQVVAGRTTVAIEEHRALLRSFAEDTALELRVPLTRLQRLIARIADRHTAAARELGDLKAICNEMWTYLDVMCKVEPREPN